MVVRVPVLAPRLPGNEARRYWPAVVVGAIVVGLFDASVVGMARHRRRRAPFAAGRFGEVGSGDVRPSRAGHGRLPEALRWQHVPRGVLVATAAVSAVLASAALLGARAPWVVALGALLPWLPALVWEGAWKFRRDRVYAIFFAVVLFQLAHMGEHSAQVLQLLATGGDLARSHGVFGQLDFELVHFVSDTGVWLVLGGLIWAFRGENRWLWVAFAAASVHEVEHLYVFWLHLAHPAFYARGGFAGIMGSGGVVGSPLARPYLHFAYNVIVVVPMVVALWDQSRRVSGWGSQAGVSLGVPALGPSRGDRATAAR
jgi:hypothetical protein